MSVEHSELERYDRAVWEYLSSISDKITYAPTRTALEIMTKREKFSDKKPWNFLSYYRDPTFDIDWERMNNPATVSGALVKLVDKGDSSGNRTATYLHHIPVKLTYNIELWASKAIEVQEMAIALITKIYMQDQVLEVPIDPSQSSRFHILDVGWEDNSDIERESDIGKIYRHTISFTIDARITMTRSVDTTKFCVVPVDIYSDFGGV